MHHLFPAIFDNIWAGDCSSVRPVGASSNVDLIAADDVIALPVEGAWVRVNNTLGAPVPGYTVTATSELASGCVSGHTFDLPATGSDGSRGALYVGRWTIAVTPPSGATVSQSVVLAPGGNVTDHTVTFVVTP